MQQTVPLETLPSEETIRSVVVGFYATVREDDLLGPVFEPRLAGHWEAHLETMVDFWSSVLLGTRTYQGRPLAVHREVGEISAEMWSRWLALFSKACLEYASEASAALFMQRAEQIAAHLSRSLAKKPLLPIQEN